jgi:hypothetical protein
MVAQLSALRSRRSARIWTSQLATLVAEIIGVTAPGAKTQSRRFYRGRSEVAGQRIVGVLDGRHTAPPALSVPVRV